MVSAYRVPAPRPPKKVYRTPGFKLIASLSQSGVIMTNRQFEMIANMLKEVTRFPVQEQLVFHTLSLHEVWRSVFDRAVFETTVEIVSRKS